MNVDEVVKRIVTTMRVREEQEGKEFGVIVMAEGLAELPAAQVPGRHSARRARPHLDLAGQPRPDVLASWWRRSTSKQTGRKRKVTGLQLGYEARCAGRTPST